MKPIKLRYQGCVVEAEILNPGKSWSEYRMRIIDPKGNEIVREEAELGGYTNLEWRLIRALPEPQRAEYRKQIRWRNERSRKMARQPNFTNWPFRVTVRHPDGVRMSVAIDPRSLPELQSEVARLIEQSKEPNVTAALEGRKLVLA